MIHYVIPDIYTQSIRIVHYKPLQLLMNAIDNKSLQSELCTSTNLEIILNNCVRLQLNRVQLVHFYRKVIEKIKQHYVVFT